MKVGAKNAVLKSLRELNLGGQAVQTSCDARVDYLFVVGGYTAGRGMRCCIMLRQLPLAWARRRGSFRPRLPKKKASPMGLAFSCAIHALRAELYTVSVGGKH